MHSNDPSPPHPSATPDSSNKNLTTNLQNPTKSQLPLTNIKLATTTELSNQETTAIATEDEVNKDQTNLITQANNQPKPSSTHNIPTQPKTSLNFDIHQPRNDQIPDNTNYPQPSHITEPSSATLSSQIPVLSNIQYNKALIDREKRTEQVISKPSFAATIQTKLPSLDSDSPPVEITYRTYLGKPIVYFTAQDYFINLAHEYKITIIGKLYQSKPIMEEIKRVFVS